MAAKVSYGTGPSSTLLAGMIPRFDGRGSQIISLLNNSRAAQVETLKCTNTSYAVTMTKGGVSRSFSGTGYADAAASAAALKTAIENDGIAGGWISATVSTDTVTCTARFAGTDDDVTYSSLTNITATETTAASDGAAIGFGLAAMYDSVEGQCVQPTKTSAVQEVWTLTPAVVNTIDYYAGATLKDGSQPVYFASYLSDGTATAKEIVEGLQAVLAGITPAAIGVWTEDDAKLTVTGPASGASLQVTAGSSNATGTWTIARTVAGVEPDFTRPIAGFTVRSNYVGNVVDYSGGDGESASEYAAGEDVAVMEAGVLVCETDDTVFRFDPVYVRITATGSEKVGSVRNDDDSGDCILLSNARFLEAASGTSTDHAPVQVQFDLSTLT